LKKDFGLRKLAFAFQNAQTCRRSETAARGTVLELRLSSGEVLEPTPPHRFYSETRQDWVAAGELRIGECLRTASGLAVSVESIGFKAGEHRVYNLEVEQEHQFYVGEAACWCIRRTVKRLFPTIWIRLIGLEKPPTHPSSADEAD
jgi:hypothetical protein